MACLFEIMVIARTCSFKSCDVHILSTNYSFQDIGRMFCAGLDLQEVQEPDRDRLTQYWRSFQNMTFDLYRSRLTTIAAINVSICIERSIL